MYSDVDVRSNKEGLLLNCITLSHQPCSTVGPLPSQVSVAVTALADGALNHTHQL